VKIAYVTTYNASDVHAWSGIGSHLLQAFQNIGLQTVSIGNLKIRNDLSYKLKGIFYRKLRSKKYLRDREPSLLIDYARQVEKRLAKTDYDIVVSPGTIPIAYLKTDRPIVFWTDATFAGMVDFYPEFSNLCAETIKNGNKMEQLALSKCSMAFYSSEWAANTAIQNYDVDPKKVKVLPFGANILCDRNLDGIRGILENKRFDICKLLFIGVDWHRKGGDTAIKVAELLNQRGIRTELKIVGCNPPVNLPGFAKCYGFVSKKTEEGARLLDTLLSESHFLIIPSRAECFGLVFAEASSFGLPAIATQVGGIPSAIQNGKNGQTFPVDAAPDTYCVYIERLMSSKQEYKKLALSSFDEYSNRLNWVSSARKLKDLIREFCS